MVVFFIVYYHSCTASSVSYTHLVNTAVESMKLGSIDYIPKQLVEDKLVPLIRSILKERLAGLRRMPIFAREGSAFQKIMHRIRLVAATDMSVMICGENGTGKEHICLLYTSRCV